MAINKIGMLGAGTMGQGIAWSLAAAGKQIVLYDIKYEFVERAINNIGKSLAKAEERGKAAPGTKDTVIGNITGTVNFDDLKDVDFVIEAVFENMEVKKDIYTKLDALLAPEVIIATNTSSLSITEIAAITKRSDKVAVEIGKKPVRVKEGPGFVVNRILVPAINEGCAILYEGLATAEGIDTAMKYGAGWPMGPLALCDLIGGDICLAVMNTLYSETGDPKYRPAGRLKQNVRAGWLGVKTKKGFYNY